MNCSSSKNPKIYDSESSWESLRSKLINYGCEVNAGADIKSSNISDDCLLKTLDYIFHILSGTKLNSPQVSSSSNKNDSTVKNLLETNDAVNCSFTEDARSMCPFIPTSHVNVIQNLATSSSVEDIESGKEFLKLLVEHESDVNLAHSDSESNTLDSEFLLLKSARKLLLQFGNDVNLDDEEKNDRDNSNADGNAENCTFLKWLMMNPGSQVNNNGANPDGLWQQEIVKLKLKRLIAALTISGNDVNSN